MPQAASRSERAVCAPYAQRSGRTPTVVTTPRPGSVGFASFFPHRIYLSLPLVAAWPTGHDWAPGAPASSMGHSGPVDLCVTTRHRVQAPADNRRTHLPRPHSAMWPPEGPPGCRWGGSPHVRPLRDHQGWSHSDALVEEAEREIPTWSYARVPTSTGRGGGEGVPVVPTRPLPRDGPPTPPLPSSGQSSL